MKIPADSVEQPAAKRLRAADLPTIVGRGVQLVGIDTPPATVARAETTIGVVDLPEPTSSGASLADQVAEAVVAKLTATGVVAPPPATTGEPERILISSDEAAALLGITRRALAKRVERHQVPGVCRVGRRIQFNKAKLLAGLDRRTRA